MPTLLEYFNNDFIDLSIDADLPVTYEEENGSIKEILTVKRRVRQDLKSSIRLFTFFIPEFADTYTVVHSIIEDIEGHMKDSNGIGAVSGYRKDIQIGIHKSLYSNRIYMYCETPLSQNQVENLHTLCKQKDLFVTIRSVDYLKVKLETEKPSAFISHDFRDKELIAKSVAKGLNSRLCTVWYDEYSLKVGQSLRESIETGIKEAKKCILILTPNFLSNPGWTKKEFNSIFTREMIFNEKIILPIWHNVTKEEVYNYSPSLADTVALIWPNLVKLSEDDYKQEVQKIISKLHTAVTQ